VEVQASDESPLGFRWNRRRHRVLDVSARWRIHTDWWTESEVWRDYWEVTTDTGLLCILFRDLLNESWFLERVLE
jgi:urease alpha subunit